MSKVREIILSSSNATCQLDPIPTWLVKKCVDTLAPIITKMINFSLDSGYIPDDWKNALITPLIKKLDLDPILKNFRPVSNLRFVSKVSEKAVISQLLDHCSKNAPLPTNQSSYRKYHSTETALLKVQNDILASMDRQEVTLLVLLDLSAAFDTIDHETMAALLESDFGVTDKALLWITSFMSGRKQRVVVEQQQSRDFEVTSGVPQGSCLGPIMFIMYASRLFHVVKKHLPNIQAYADDTQLYLSFKPDSSDSQKHAILSMERCISDIKAWMAQSYLKLNDSKTDFLIIGSRQQLAKIKITNIHVGPSEIKPVSTVRNLGAWFDTYMTMKTHIGKACSKAFYGLYKIKQIRGFLSVDTTKTLMHAFVTSNIDYCNSLLYGLPKCQTDRLQKVLNAAARVTCCVPRSNHITPVLRSLHWLPIVSRIKFKIALLVFKALQGMLPSYLMELLHAKKPSRYDLRNDYQQLLVIPKTKCKTFGERAFSVAGPKVWNNLPLSIKQIGTINAFKSKLKTHIFQEAFN